MGNIEVNINLAACYNYEDGRSNCIINISNTIKSSTGGETFIYIGLQFESLIESVTLPNSHKSHLKLADAYRTQYTLTSI